MVSINLGILVWCSASTSWRATDDWVHWSSCRSSSFREVISRDAECFDSWLTDFNGILQFLPDNFLKFSFWFFYFKFALSYSAIETKLSGFRVGIGVLFSFSLINFVFWNKKGVLTSSLGPGI